MWIVWLEKKILKTLGILLSIIIILITALHIYVVNNAEKLIEDLVNTESKGKLKLKVKNIRFNYFSKKVELENVIFFSNDSLDLRTAYHFQVDNIRMQVKALVPIFTRRELRIDSIFLSSPKIEVTRLKPVERTSNKQVSIPREMGRIYNSIMDALQFLEVKRFQFDEGQFRLVNKIIPGQQPLEITRLHFHIDNLKIDTTTSGEDFPLTDQMVFRTRGQDITFPDGNHRLAFSRFRINIRKRLIEIDSCTLTGKRNDTSRSGFSIFLDTLKLTKVDFESLYEYDLIKADSVYCLNPDFKIELELRQKPFPGNSKTNPRAGIPNIDTLINQLTGDLQLGYIGVNNAAVNIVTHRGESSTSFTSDKNNFEMRGLTIDHSLPQPVTLQGFDMAIRNYENFVKDSSYFLRFDSIRLRENRILLSNFSINTEPYKDKRNILVQQFILSGLSWADLLFDRKVIARQATLLNPVIDYEQKPAPKFKKQNPLATSLAGIHNFMSLDKIRVENGEIKVKTLSGVNLLLEEANLSLISQSIADSLSVENIESSVEELSFKKGIMKTKKLMVNMDKLLFNGINKQLALEKIRIYDRQQRINLIAKNVKADSLLFSDSASSIHAAALNWQQAQIEINRLAKTENLETRPLIISVKNINGANTQLDYNSASTTLSAFLITVSADSVEKLEKLKLYALKTSGKNLGIFTSQASAAAAEFSVTDMEASSFSGFEFAQTKNKNTTEVKTPLLVFTPDVSSIISGSPELSNLKLAEPEIKISIAEKASSMEKKPLPNLSIDKAEFIHPTFKLENFTSKGLQNFFWDGSENNVLIKNIQTEKPANRLSIASVNADITRFKLTNAEGKTTSSKEGKLDLLLSDFIFTAGDKPTWSALIKELKAASFSADSLGKKAAQLTLKSSKLENLMLGSETGSRLETIIDKNPFFTVSNVSGQITDDKNKWTLSNLSYSHPGKLLSVDSFLFQPLLSRDEFVAASAWQTDYITFSSGKINISGIDFNRYVKDSVVTAGILRINNPMLTSYRDKRPPFRAGIIKPLPSKLLQKIPIKISVDTAYVSNGTAVYTELNDKTQETGIVPVTRISGDIFPIRNFGISPTDTFRIRLNGYLLDSAWIRLRTRESMYDSLSGFQITLRMRPQSLLYLNEILPPLASVKIQSGYLDTLVMRAVGREYLALGQMRMYYHDLKVQFLKNGSEDQKRFLQGLVTFIANSFVIKNENKKRSGVVYFPRLRDRSFINYYIKIAMSGVASSIGAKKNKRLLRRYQKQLKLRQLPPVDID
jgi:hypothetical protein